MKGILSYMSFWIFAVVSLLLVACEPATIGNEPQNNTQTPITFSKMSATPEDNISLSALDQIYTTSFKLWGGYGTTPVFNPIEVNILNGSYSDTQYWKSDEKYDFWALYPSSLDNANFDINTKTLTISNFNVSDGVDLLVATNFGVDAPTSEPEPVNLHFYHRLVQLEFAAASHEKDLPAVLTSIKLTGLYSSGTYTITKIGEGEESEKWRDYGATTFEPSLSKTITLSPCVKDDEGNITNHSTVWDGVYVLPQNPAEVTITIGYKNEDGTNETASATLPGITGGGSWKIGNKYRYTFSVEANGNIVFSVPTVEDWRTGSAGSGIVVCGQ